MANTKEKRDILNLTDGAPTQVTFDYDVSSAKSIEVDSKWSDTGKAIKFILNVNGDKVIFASEALYAKLKDFQKGESAVISFVEKRWIVNQGGDTSNSNTNIQKKLVETETMVLLRGMYEMISQMHAKTMGVTPPVLEAEKLPTDDDDLGF